MADTATTAAAVATDTNKKDAVPVGEIVTGSTTIQAKEDQTKAKAKPQRDEPPLATIGKDPAARTSTKDSQPSRSRLSRSRRASQPDRIAEPASAASMMGHYGFANEDKDDKELGKEQGHGGLQAVANGCTREERLKQAATILKQHKNLDLKTY